VPDIEVLPSIPSDDSADSSSDAEKEINVELFGKYFNSFDLIVDSIFGFSFEGTPREPFRSIIAALARTQVPLISVDIPSG
jgi:NAD(P)H-hydrate repair Nnr-like enzyme with NAD(P)H-hydrate epimerase domain